MTNEEKWVLVVDDDEDIRDTVLLVLESHGYHAVAAADGVEALDVLRSARVPPSLILLDVMMPGLRGDELVECLKDQSLLRNIPIVILSGDTSAGRLAERHVAEGCLTKPVELERLLGTVRQYIAA